MNNIVTELIKVDLHIHSVHSTKDGSNVKNNTIENIPKLYEAIEQKEVNMIALTDHNVFNYDMYNAMKINIKECNCIHLKKVLPGIEFDIRENNHRFHVISIFDDTSDEKLRRIETILSKNPFNSKGKNGKKDAYTYSTFRSILTDIDLNVVLIVHQKSGVRVDNHNENLSGVGEEAFDYIVNCEYFDALEFRTGRVEGILKAYKNEKGLQSMRYLTGSDCHDWLVYPKQNQSDKSNIRYTYIKSLPTFKGLVMALTEIDRLSTASYDIRKPYINSFIIKDTENKKEHVVNLSSGLNVIIGDNSIGKSMVLEYLHNPKLNGVSQSVKKGYKDYCKKKKIEIVPFDSNSLIGIKCDKQGSIRSMFQDRQSLNNYPIFQDKFNTLKIDEYLSKFDLYISRVLNRIQKNQDHKTSFQKLDYCLTIPAEVEDDNYNLHTVSNLSYSLKDYNSIINKLGELITKIEELLAENNLFTYDKQILEKNLVEYQRMKQGYIDQKNHEKNMSEIASVINTTFKRYEDKVSSNSEDQETKKNKFNNDVIEFINRIVNYIEISVNNDSKEILNDFITINIESEDNLVDGYHFITRTQIQKIDSTILEKALSIPFKKTDKLTILKDIDNDNFIDMCADSRIKSYLEKGNDINTAYSECVKDYIKNEVLQLDYSIIRDEDLGLSGNSPGKNALIYLDLFSNDSNYKMYLVDQPGDDVSQNKITTDLIEILKKMSRNKQVLFITHKPELVVNLDVDNVIVFKNSKDGIVVNNGALEYECDEVNILKEVADTLDGGVEVIRKRWKRYDKNN